MTRLVTMLLGLVIGEALVGAEPPARCLDLTDWNLTLPVDTARGGNPDEVEQPELDSFVDLQSFFVNEQADGVVFRAHCGGSTTKGSSFPRCELREMTDRGRQTASWNTDGEIVHTLKMRVAITKTPPVKSHVVCAQIHDAHDDLMMIRLEGKKLFVERNSVGDILLDREYKLGSPFDVEIQAGNGKVKVWYQGELAMDWRVSRSGCYFKAGCYTQSNPVKGDAADSYGEVVIHRLLVTHRDER